MDALGVFVDLAALYCVFFHYTEVAEILKCLKARLIFGYISFDQFMLFSYFLLVVIEIAAVY